MFRSKQLMRSIRFVVVAMILVALLPLSSFASSATYEYDGNQVRGTRVVVDQLPTMYTVPGLFEMKNQMGDDLFNAYCAQWGVTIEQGVAYTVKPLSTITPQVDKVRGIIKSSFPYVSANEFRNAVGNQALTESDMVTITQLALWKVLNDVNPIESSGRTPAYIFAPYNYLLNVPSVPAPAVSVIEMSKPKYKQEGNTIYITFSYGPKAPTSDKLDLKYVTNLPGFKEVSKVTTGNTTEVVLSKKYCNINYIDDFSRYAIKVYGTQYLIDVMALIPNGLSQTLITYDKGTDTQLQSTCYRLPRYCPIPNWKQYDRCYYNFYHVGEKVVYNGHTYQARIPHYVFSSAWTPSNAPSLWKLID